eukprot:357322-Chlamydomonas_euryale.AAC.4
MGRLTRYAYSRLASTQCESTLPGLSPANKQGPHMTMHGLTTSSASQRHAVNVAAPDPFAQRRRTHSLRDGGPCAQGRRTMRSGTADHALRDGGPCAGQLSSYKDSPWLGRGFGEARARHVLVRVRGDSIACSSRGAIYTN